MRRILRFFLVSYILVVMLFGFFQRKLLYRPSTAQSLPVKADRDLINVFPASQDVRLMCRGKTEIGAWWLRQEATPPGEISQRPLILYFHGNANDRSTRGPWYELFADTGADVFAIDYPGYGDSEGTMTEGAMYASCDATWEYVTKTLNYPPSRIVVAGTSLGGAAAVYTAEKASVENEVPAALFVTASFSSMVDVASSLYPWLPVSVLLVDRYPSVDRITNVKCPIVVTHGDQDRLVSPKYGRKLFDAAPAESHSGHAKRWVSLPNLGHNGLVERAGEFILKEVKTVVQFAK